ncbi:unnamed protein product [Camellia sinensis]
MGVGRVGIVGSEFAGRGDRVIFGTVNGIVGKDDGIWVLGNGGNVGFVKVGTFGKVVVGIGGNVGFGKVGGAVGSVGKGVVGIGDNVGFGKVGIDAGNGGNVSLGTAGIAGIVCRRWRVARLVWMLESDNANVRERTKQR